MSSRPKLPTKRSDDVDEESSYDNADERGNSAGPSASRSTDYHRQSKSLDDKESWSLGIPSTLIGIMVHAAADGIAMGAAAISFEPAVETILFIALTLHKAPEAFGLVTTLLQSGFPRNRMRNWLVIFSLAAPVAAILSYLLLSLVLPQPSSSIYQVSLWAGRILLFSGSTFLYVALCHTLPEAMDSVGPGRLGIVDAMILLSGMVIPFVLAIVFAH